MMRRLLYRIRWEWWFLMGPLRVEYPTREAWCVARDDWHAREPKP